MNANWICAVLVLISCAASVVHTASTDAAVFSCFSQESRPEPVQVATERECGGDGGSEGNCTLLTEALEGLDSSSSLHLLRGVHRITRHVPTSSLQDIAIFGDGESSVTVECEEGVGLSFLNVSRLTLCGFTVNGCGLTGPPVAAIEQWLRGNVGLWFVIPAVVRYAVVLASCWNVSFSYLEVTNTRGMGFLAINVLGESHFHRVSFTSNVQENCSSVRPRFPFNASEPEIQRQIGGGAYFLYQGNGRYEEDTLEKQQMETHSLVIRESLFSQNAECSFAAITHVNYQQIAEYTGNPFQVGAGGGLSLVLGQQGFNMEATVKDSNFTENNGRFGAGMYVAIFTGVELSQVTVHGCLFHSNGIDTHATGGAGLAVFTDLIGSNDVEPSIPGTQHNYSVLIQVTDTEFRSNEASVEGGGFLAYSLFTTPHRVLRLLHPAFYNIRVEFRNCLFHNNSAKYGAAAYLQQNSHQGRTGSLLLHMADIFFTENKAAEEDTSGFRFLRAVPSSGVTSAVALVNVYVTIGGGVAFMDNAVTGLLLQSSIVFLFYGQQLLFHRNSGKEGGGVHMTGEASAIIFGNNVTLSFRDNSASLFGGAMFISPSIDSNDILRPFDLATGCFMSPLPISNCFYEDCFSPASLEGTRVEFSGNRAPWASVLFGSTMEACTWRVLLKPYAETLGGGERPSLFHLLHEFIDEVSFDVAPNTSAVVSTFAATVSIRLPKGSSDISSYTNDTGSGGGGGGGGGGGIGSLRVVPGQKVSVEVGVFDSFGYPIPATVTPSILNRTAGAVATLGGSEFFLSQIDHNATNLTIHGPEDQNLTILLTELSSLVSARLSVTIAPCSWGFSFDEETLSCVCSSTLEREGVRCDLDSMTLVSPDKVWIGVLQANFSTDDVVVDVCYLGYCYDGDKVFLPPHFDQQCRAELQRTGVLCGACLPGYSAVLGSIECQRCSNLYLLLLPVFGVLGVALFLVVAVLEATVDKGWMDSLLLYLNLLPLSSLSVYKDRWTLIYIPAHFISLKLGVGVCLYHGMTTLHKAFLHLLFPLYLFLLMTLFTLASRKFTISRHFSPVKTFVTLGVMSYSSILDICVEIVTATTLNSVTGVRSLRWLHDPNVVYGRAWHGGLLLLAGVLLLTYVIPVPLLLLSPRVTYRLSSKLKLKLAPFFDALWAPYQPQRRWWLGMRLLLRAVLFFSTSFLMGAGNLVRGLVLLAMLEVQLIARPFSAHWVNVLDSVLLGNLIALTFGAIFFERREEELPGNLYVVLTVLIGYAIVVGILCRHFSVKWKLREKWRSCVARKQQEVATTTTTTATTTTVNSLENLQQTPDLAGSRRQGGGAAAAGGLEDPSVHVVSRVGVSLRLQDEVTELPLSRSPYLLVQADYSHLRETLLDDFSVSPPQETPKGSLHSADSFFPD